MGSDTKFLQSKGKGRHNRRIGDGSFGRSGPGGSYVFPVLAYVTFGGGEAFGKVFVDKSGGSPCPCGIKTRGDCRGTDQHDWAEGRLMEVMDNVGLGGKCMDVVRKRGGRKCGC